MNYQPSYKWILCSTILFGISLIAACEPSGNGATVSGTVTVDGQQVEHGSIAIMPVDGGGPSSGAPIKDGKYSVDAWPGKSKVEIYVPKVVGKEKMDGEDRVVMAESLPAKFNSETELELDISPGRNEKNWSLSVKAGQ